MEAVGSDGQTRQFNHPFVQACSMFIGEMLCLLAFKLLYFYYWRKHVSILFWLICVFIWSPIICVHLLLVVLLTSVILTN